MTRNKNRLSPRSRGNERTNERRVVEDSDHLLRSNSTSSSTRLVVRSFDVPLSLLKVDERQLEREVHKETPLFPLRCVFSGRRKRRPSFFLFLSLDVLLVLLVRVVVVDVRASRCVHESSEYVCVCVNKAL